MGIDCEFRASAVLDVDRVKALPGVCWVYRPGQGGALGHKTKWVIGTTIKWVGPGYATNERRPRVAALIRALRECTRDLEYGDGGYYSPFVEVTDELIAEIEKLS